MPGLPKGAKAACGLELKGTKAAYPGYVKSTRAAYPDSLGQAYFGVAIAIVKPEAESPKNVRYHYTEI